jgi:hypothetical protein
MTGQEDELSPTAGKLVPIYKPLPPVPSRDHGNTFKTFLPFRVQSLNFSLTVASILDF